MILSTQAGNNFMKTAPDNEKPLAPHEKPERI